MSVISCSNCAKPMNEGVFVCPGCGQRRQDVDRPLASSPPSAGVGEAPYKDYNGWLIIVVFLLVILGVAFFITRGDGRLSTDPPAAGEAAKETFQGRPNWRLAGQVGEDRFVVMAETVRDLAEYQAAGEQLCRDRRPCSVGFWTDAALVPKALPLTPEQAAGQMAMYQVDGQTGAGAWRWRCSRFDDAAPNECL
jgi:hypothetical protein